MGPRDDDDSTRVLVRSATGHLTRLKTIEIGKELRNAERASELEPRDHDEKLSFAIFADFFRLPAIESVFARKIAPEYPTSIGPWEETYEGCFAFVRDISTENQSLKRLALSEACVSEYSGLRNLLERLPALEWFELLRAEYVHSG